MSMSRQGHGSGSDQHMKRMSASSDPGKTGGTHTHGNAAAAAAAGAIRNSDPGVKIGSEPMHTEVGASSASNIIVISSSSNLDEDKQPPPDTWQEVTKVWQKIFESDAGFTPANAAGIITGKRRKSTRRESVRRQSPPSQVESTTSTDYISGIAADDDVSHSSIVPAAITISSDLGEGSSGRRRKKKMSCGEFLRYHYVTSTYNWKKSKFSCESHHVEKYYNDSLKLLETVETELYHDMPDDFSDDINLVGARIWFVTLALGKQTNSYALEPEALTNFQGMYQCLVDYSLWFQDFYPKFDATLDTFAKIQEDVKKMKKAFSGTSDTDLQTGFLTEGLFLGDNSSTEKLVVRALQYQKKWEAGVINPVRRIDASNDFMAYAPDTLPERKSMDIFMRNITKSGWVNFQVRCLPKVRIALMMEILNQTTISLKNLKKMTPKLLKKYKLGTAAGCTECRSGIPKRIQRMIKHLDYILQSANYQHQQSDIDFVRMHIFAVELLITNLQTRGNLIRLAIINILETIVLSTDFLERTHVLTVPKVENWDMLKKEWNALNSKAQEGFDDGSFYLNEYILFLKQVPIRHGMVEYLLINKVTSSTTHSGANFDGPRFLRVG